MPGRWFIGDPHFGHEKVAQLRGFSSTDEHDASILDVWRRRVAADDEVFVLGDLSGGSTFGEGRALALIGELPGVKHLIAGNHDSVSSIHRGGHKSQRRFLEVFESVRDFGRLRVEGREVLMSHYPYALQGDGPNREGVRYLQYRLPDLGVPLIHAHTHHTKPVDVDPRQLCVSWDAWGRMVNLGDVARWVQGVG